MSTLPAFDHPRSARRWPTLAALTATVMLAAGLWASGSAAASGSSAAASAVAPTTSCSALASLDLLTLEGAQTSITSASAVAASANPAGSWAACEVQGIIAPETHFTLYLPTTTYAGEYLQEGCGGGCGSINTGYPTAAAGCTQATDGDFAVAADDEGHEGGGFSVMAFQDPELKAVFGYESEHQLALVSKAIIKGFYGSAPAQSYFDGCSDGGREALTEAQRYPTDFNGIIAGSPASIQSELNAFEEAWNAQANTGANGTPILTSADLAPLHTAVLQACGGASAVSLGYLADPLACTWNPASIACKPGQTSTSSDFCLTAAQVETVDKLYAGPTDAQGERLYPGYEVRGSELNWAGWIVPSGNAESGAIDANIATTAWQDWITPTGTFDGAANYMDVQFTKANFEKVTKENDGELDATDPNLSAFEKAGGKLILWAGYADPAINPVGTISYYQAVTKAMGGLAATERFAKLYLLPGVAHCGGGQGPNKFDALTAITAWVTEGTAPTSLLATSTDSSGTVTASLPIYSYPDIAVDTTGGPATSAASYTPQVSRAEQNLNISWLGSFGSGYEQVSGWVDGQWVTRPANLGSGQN
ncbi:tannase/feruloyl esterase family alpha/beta hydrolase [Actinospica sp. MGRD01-02]|uniref:Tannase/feruloyl esterase family alpha/beta hydrolase n=1 Tax=Actinospica acidithermotolerans TaxID=2828514 RepID=A0A941IHL5_9ACTN|nr:tannase/feruloyl esterase family alpha/beta hydrolase [Actinospica acidithermotolerans]MBR7827339.1 tannase/feruloyl esterase family alpha/beta hydrolase [Actinospica acidithermotolerans]